MILKFSLLRTSIKKTHRMFLYLNLAPHPVFQKRRPDNITYGKLNERIIIYTFDKVSLVDTQNFDIISGHVQLKRIKTLFILNLRCEMTNFVSFCSSSKIKTFLYVMIQM
jgi:hypothetical protein